MKEDTLMTKKINTHYECAPIPMRGFDWVATFDDYDGAPDSQCPIGKGATEQEAIDDLLEQNDR